MTFYIPITYQLNFDLFFKSRDEYVHKKNEHINSIMLLDICIAQKTNPTIAVEIRKTVYS